MPSGLGWGGADIPVSVQRPGVGVGVAVGPISI